MYSRAYHILIAFHSNEPILEVFERSHVSTCFIQYRARQVISKGAITRNFDMSLGFLVNFRVVLAQLL